MEQMKAVPVDGAKVEEGLFKICCKLLSDAIIDRLRRMEANALITNFMLLVAFRFGILHVIIRMAVTFVLTVLVYFINDFIDVDIDLASENKNHSKSLYLRQHRRTAFSLIVCMSAGLIMLTMFYSRSVCFGVILALSIIFLYTDYLKNMAYFDVLGCLIWGISMAWPAIPDFSWQGVKLILLIGIFTATFEVVQCVKDYEFDKKYNLKTTPIVIGIPNSFLLVRVLCVASTLYTVFVLRQIQGVIVLLPILFSTQQKMETYWMKLRIVFGLVWITLMVRLFFGWYQG
jgi:4-hydroxybenzoate polyprenyltransferase